MLFNDTILHNVAYGRPGARMGDVRAAAAAAKLDAAIARMPAGGQLLGRPGGWLMSAGLFCWLLLLLRLVAAGWHTAPRQYLG